MKFSLLTIVLLTLLPGLAPAADKAPVDLTAEAKYRNYFGFAQNVYATPAAVLDVLGKWFPAGTPRAKIQAVLAHPGELTATWDNSEHNKPHWDIAYSFTDVWDGKRWVRNFYCVDIIFKFGADDRLVSMSGRWILVPI